MAMFASCRRAASASLPKQALRLELPGADQSRLNLTILPILHLGQAISDISAGFCLTRAAKTPYEARIRPNLPLPLLLVGERFNSLYFMRHLNIARCAVQCLSERAVASYMSLDLAACTEPQDSARSL